MKSALRGALFTAAWAAAATAGAQEVTLIHFNSEPGDYIGQGQVFTLTPANGTITATRQSGGVHIAFNGTTWWDLYFVPPAGMQLTPGAYEGATRWPFQSPTTPGLSVSGDGRGCNTLTGRFVVLEAEYGPGGEVLSFAVDYEQHCEGGSPALFGYVRYSSSVSQAPRLSIGSAGTYEGDSGATNLRFVVALSAPASSTVTVAYATQDATATAGSDYTAVSGTATFPPGETMVFLNVPVLGDTAEETDETFTLTLSNPTGAAIAFGEGVGTILNDDPYRTLIYFNSEPGDYIGQGQQFTLTPADGTITASRQSGGVHIGFDGDTWWDLYFVPPAGVPLAPGIYEGATRWPFQSPTMPGLSVSGDGRGCNTLTGRFVVLEAEYGPANEVVRFAADYEQHCEGGNPALFGSVRFASSVPLGHRLSISSARTYEGDSGSLNLRFVVSLSAPASGTVTVAYATQDGTATAGSDYTAVSGTATFPPGETQVLVNVPVLGDTTEETDETFTLSLSNPTGATIAFGQGVGTILNEDPYKTLIYFNSEPGDYIGQGQQFTLTPADGTITATRQSGGVHIGFDGDTWWDLYFVPPAGVPLAPGIYEGATRWPFQSPTTPGLSVSGDGRGCNTLTGRFVVLEAEYGPANEVVRFAADYEQHCEGGNPALFGSVRFASSVPLGPRLSISSARTYEGDSGSLNLRFVVSLSAPAGSAVTVTYATQDGTASAGSDYTAVSGTASFPPGETVVVVNVPVLGDSTEEADETFTLSLSNPSGAPVAFGQGLGTIRNDDPYKTLVHFNSEAGDYIGGGQQYTLTQADGTIIAGRASGGVHIGFDGDTWWDLYFVPPAGFQLTPGVYEGARRWPFQPPGSPGLDVSGDGRGCNTLTGRFVVLEAEYGPGGEVVRFAVDYEQHCEGGTPALFGAVRYNSAVPLLRLELAAVSVLEGNTGVRNLDFPLTLSAAPTTSLSVRFRTLDGTATGGSDYAGGAGSLTIAAGQTAAVIGVPVFGDALAEADETFYLAVAPGPYVTPVQVTGTILNDDVPPQMSVGDVALLEGSPGQSAQAVFTVSLTSASADAISVSYTTQPGTATSADYTPSSGTLQLAPGTTSATLAVPVTADLLDEADETFSLLLFFPVNVELTDALGVATILDDDAPLGFHTVTPCRLLDTRLAGPALAAAATRTFEAGGRCGIPATAKAAVLNITAVVPGDDGHLQLYPTDAPPPNTSVVNFARSRTRAGNTVARLGSGARLTLRSGIPPASAGVVHVVVDVYGYFE